MKLVTSARPVNGSTYARQAEVALLSAQFTLALLSYIPPLQIRIAYKYSINHIPSTNSIVLQNIYFSIYLWL